MSEDRIIQALKAQAGASGQLSFADFMATVLYQPEIGYYRRPVRRVGRHREADFYTSESIGPIFGKLVLAAAQTLLGESLSGFTFVELGAEPGGSPLADLAAERCAGYRAVGPGEPLALCGPCVVFGNEVLDAQPCHRLLFTEGQWRECGVSIHDDGLRECLLSEFSEALNAAQLPLPEVMPEGYRLDLPLAAEGLLDTILMEPWTGLLVLPDYGHFWQTLISERPAGTVRAYYRHEQSSDLLTRPGDQDLTSHVCWDRLEAVLTRHGCAPCVQRQESFFVHHASAAIEAIITTQAAGFSRDKQSLQELLHPHHLGAKFQVLHALKA